MTSKIKGLIAATYTPLTGDGELNLSQVGPLVEHLLSNGVDGLFVREFEKTCVLCRGMPISIHDSKVAMFLYRAM